MININNEVVYEFLARPDQEYLEAMVKQAIYLSTLKRI
jgi:hypothetical protein